MLSNEEFALGCLAYYAEQGLIVDETNGEFAHCPLPERYGDKGYYLLHEHHQHQGLLQSKDVNECCFFVGHAKKWLEELDYFPDNYFELWDIYEKYTSAHQSDAGKVGGKIAANRIHEEKDPLGRSVQGLKSAKRMHAKRDELGRSVQGVRNAKRLNTEKDEFGRSANAVKGAEKTNAIKDEQGRSLAAMKMVSQVWESKIDGFRSGPSQVAAHNRAKGWDPNARIRVY
jgi:hypothetical protein